MLVSAFLFPSTGSGTAALPNPGVPSRSRVASAWHDAWYARLPTSTVSSHTHSCAVSSHLFSKRSWQMGHTVLTPREGSGTGIYFGLLASASLEAFAEASSGAGMWSASTTSRDLRQSCRKVSVCVRIEDKALTYVLVDIPTPVHASLLGLGGSLMDPKMPIHVSRLHLPPLCIRLEPSATLGARRSKSIVESRKQRRVESIRSVSTHTHRSLIVVNLRLF